MAGKCVLVCFVCICVAISSSNGEEETWQWAERMLNVLRRINRPDSTSHRPDHRPEHAQNHARAGQNGEQGQGQRQGQADQGQGQSASEQGQSQAGEASAQGQSASSNNGQSTAAPSASSSITSTTATSTVSYSDDEVVEKIKKGEITDAHTVFNYLTFDRFNWDNGTCIKCLIEDFRREIAACYDDRLQYDPDSRPERRRNRRQDSYYNCYWCGSCYK